MKLKNDRIKGLFLFAISIIAIILISMYRGENPNQNLIQLGKLVLLGFALSLLLKILDRLKLIDLKKQHQEQIDLERRLKRNKMNKIWLILGAIGFFLFTIGTLFIFLELSQTDSNVWEFKEPLFQNLKLFLFTFLYLFWGYVLILGIQILSRDKSKKGCHLFFSLFILVLFTSYIIGVSDSPSLLLVIFMLCLSSTWVQFVTLNVIKNLKDDALLEK